MDDSKALQILKNITGIHTENPNRVLIQTVQELKTEKMTVDGAPYCLVYYEINGEGRWEQHPSMDAADTRAEQLAGLEECYLAMSVRGTCKRRYTTDQGRIDVSSEPKENANDPFAYERRPR